MKSNTLISVRSNCNFGLDYETGKLRPQTEVILITTSPKYVLDKKKSGYTKEIDIQEFRFLSSIDGLNTLIGELQLLLQNVNHFEQMSAGLNAVLSSAKENEPPKQKSE
jgi:hypothetical protein